MSAPIVVSPPFNCKNFFYDHTKFRVGHENIPDIMISMIDRIKDQLLTCKRFLPDLSSKKRNPRSERRSKSAYILSHLCHWIDLNTYDGHGFKTWHKNQFTIEKLEAALGIPWSTVQSMVSGLVSAGYLKVTYFWHARGKSTTQFTITAKLFSHLRFFRETLIKAAKNALSSAQMKKREKEYVQATNKGKDLPNKAPYQKTSQDYRQKPSIEIKSGIKPIPSLKDYLKSIIGN